MAAPPATRYKGKNYDPNYLENKCNQMQSHSDFNNFHQPKHEGWNLNRDSKLQQGRQYDRHDDTRDPHGTGASQPSVTHQAPRGPRGLEASPAPANPPAGSPIGQVHPSRLGLVPNMSPTTQTNSQIANTPSLTSQPSSSSNQPQPVSPSDPLASDMSLGSLDKLRQFKAEVEATRRQRNAPELQPAKLAQMAQSFLLSQQQEPGEVAEDQPKAQANASPKTREQELKEKLRSRLQSNDADSATGVKRERPETGEIVEPSEHKRPRADEPFHKPEQRSQRDNRRDDRLEDRSHAQPIRQQSDRQASTEQANSRGSRLPELPSRPKDRDAPRQPAALARKEHSKDSMTMAAPARLPSPERKEAHRPSATNLVPARYQNRTQTPSRAEPARRPISPKKPDSYTRCSSSVIHGNGGRFSIREETPASRKESSGYERRSLSE